MVRPTFYVGPGNCDDARPASMAASSITPWCSVRRAGEAAPPGSQILVAAGRYAAFTMEGTAPGVTFRAQDPRSRPQLVGMTLKGVTGVTFREFVFTNVANAIGTRDLRIEDNGFAGSNLYLRQTRGTSVVGNRFRHAGSATRRRGLAARPSTGA